MKKLLHLCLLITFQFGYLEWGKGYHTFIFQAEAEIRWQFWKRLSLVGFIGAGKRWSEFDRFDDSGTVTAGGTGIRYELARRHGMHAGIDVAFGPEDPAIYVQFGSAWARP